MPSLKDIRKRITSVKNTQKVTKAMKLVAAAKLRRAQRAAVASRAYVEALRGIAERVAARAIDVSHPLMESRAKGSMDLILLTSDRGLCGSFNENLIREGLAWAKKRLPQPTHFMVVGRKGREALRRHQVKAQEIVTTAAEGHAESIAHELTTLVTNRFLTGTAQGAMIVYNRFYSIGRQAVAFDPLLPIACATGKKEHLDYLYEPTRAEATQALVTEVLFRHVVQALLDSRASELAARMQAMDNATRNANDMIGFLTLLYNRARQASITKELLDIVGGAEALKEN